MLSEKLKSKYAVTDKVTAAKFRNATLGLVDLGTISEDLAKKLVKTGHLKPIAQEPAKGKELGKKEGEK